MLAARYHRPGPPDVLRLEEVPDPVPRPGQVLVRVRATSVNGGEVHLRSGRMRFATVGRRTLGVGMDLAGVVEAVGDGVTDLRSGQRVWGVLPALAALAPLGAAAELVVVDADRLGIVPDLLDDAGAVALLGGGTTSMTALFTHGRLQEGHRVLVRGAAGGVGYVAVQLAHAAGAHVTAVARGSAAGHVRDLGADVVLDYRAPLPVHLERFDLVLDTVGGSGLGRFRRLVAPGGRMVTIAATTLPAAAAVVASAVHGSRRVRFFSGNPTRTDLAALSEHVQQGHLRPVVATSWPLAQIADAHRAMEAGGAVGKHVVMVA
ncbi:NAD(P)-dependent alcohol dehydrogenase [Cellulomonas endometrii]|uniref:NAD(P)-dependent alcohol dehydrogenase n=1 Tax=Cellulomonas endometrii TaxID=3036301 RepID=UPI0024AD7CE0|nr:NAD(P)-dependent alcohol dehydrogenase [Cellulomonas endometrii]